VTLPLAGSLATRRVAAYWFDVLLGTALGRALHAEILTAPAPPGGLPAAGAAPGVDGRARDGCVDAVLSAAK
jgi:hypothetical protein